MSRFTVWDYLGGASLVLYSFAPGFIIRGSGYHVTGFIAAYIAMLGLPFMWASVPFAEAHFKKEIGLSVGFGAVIVAGLCHLLFTFANAAPFSIAGAFSLISATEAMLAKDVCFEAEYEAK